MILSVSLPAPLKREFYVVNSFCEWLQILKKTTHAPRPLVGPEERSRVWRCVQAVLWVSCLAERTSSSYFVEKPCVAPWRWWLVVSNFGWVRDLRNCFLKFVPSHEIEGRIRTLTRKVCISCIRPLNLFVILKQSISAAISLLNPDHSSDLNPKSPKFHIVIVLDPPKVAYESARIFFPFVGLLRH